MEKKKVNSYRDLVVWQKAMDMVTEIYRITQSLPKEEIYGLISQTRRAAVSVPANIAEGWGRNMTKDYINFLRIARSSLAELETHLIISKNLNFIDENSLSKILLKTKELNIMLNSMMNSLTYSQRAK